ncbi:extracellular solute-binding protein [Thioclava sp. BHET1]|nr:extracellular solute-binding protein [Thioclava sp. BHET1]
MKTVLAAASALLALSTGIARADEPTLTISVYAFSQDAYDRILYKPFEAQCRCHLVVETGNSAERLAKMEANKADPVVDMAVMSRADALDASNRGLTDVIDTAKLPNIAKLYDIAKDPNHDGKALGYTFYTTSIAYRSDKVTVTSWKDLLSKKLAGHVAFPNITTTQGAPALYMLGKAMGEDQPDLKAPITALGQHRDDMVTFYVRSSQIVQLFAQDEIWAAPVGRFAWAPLTKLGLPIKWATPTEGQTGGMNVMVVTKGSKHRDLALEFMNFWLSTPVQTALADALVDSPANKEVTVSPEIANNITYGAETAASLKLIPSAVSLANRDAWLNEWNAAVED